MEWVLVRGGDGVRTGLEDNIRITKDRLAKSNAELVQVAAEAIAKQAAGPRPRRRPARPSTSGPPFERVQAWGRTQASTHDRPRPDFPT